MTPEEKELIALKRLRYQVNRFMWTPRSDGDRLYKATVRLNKAWRVSEARDTAKATTSEARDC